jgi:hypothetical protein
VGVPGTPTIPGNLTFSFSASADLLGTKEIQEFTTKIKASLGTAVSIVAPATPNVIWRINVIYNLGY